MTERKPRIKLIPWDYDSNEHVERMFLQRLACGWRSDEVREKWTTLGREGKKTTYWVVCTGLILPMATIFHTTDSVALQVLRDDFPDREKLLAQHIAGYPKVSTHTRLAISQNRSSTRW